MKEDIEILLVRLLNTLDLETNNVSAIRSNIIKSQNFEHLLKISDLEQSLLRLQDEICNMHERIKQE